MTDEQRAKRLHHHLYESCEGIREQSERIVALEELVQMALKCIDSHIDCYECRIVAGGCTLRSRMRELGVMDE